MSPLQLFLLGVPEVRQGGQPVHLRTRKMLALLAYLAVEGRAHARDELAELLWPGPPERARGALRLALHHIRAALGGGLEVSRDGVELPRGGGLWVDVLELEARAGSREGAPDPAAVGLWRGDFLQGLRVGGSAAWDDWVEARALECADRFGGLLARLARAQLEAGEVREAVVTARRWVGHDGLSEDAYLLLARAQRAAGHHADALVTERTCAEVLRRELGVAPAAMTELPPFLVGGPLIGRQAEFGRLVEAYRSAAGGAPQAALLGGEPGIGKTRLAGELLAWAQSRRAPLLLGRALETAGTAGQPFAALAEALRREGAHLKARLEPRHLDDLSRLLPELREGPEPPAGGDLRSRLLEALGAAVLGLAPPAGAGEPLVLLLDDLHWADASTREALLHLAARLGGTGAPVLLLFTARAEYLGTGTPLDGWLARLRHHLPLLTLTLGPLDPRGTRHLLTGHLPRAPGALIGLLADWLFGQTGGQPLYLTETLRSLMESGALTDGPQGPRVDEERLPRRVEGVRAAIGERLSRLTPAALALAQGAAVLGGSAPFGVLRAVADLGEEEALAGYEELLRCGLLLELRSGGETQAMLSHDRVRETLRDALSGPRRQALHRRALGALGDRGGVPPATLAAHALGGGLRTEAAALFEQAAHAAAAVGAFDEAGQALERALELVPLRPEQQETRLRLLVLLSRRVFARDAGLSPALLGRLRGAAQAAGAAGVSGEQAAALQMLGAELLHAGRLDEAETCARTALLAAQAAHRPRDEVLALLGLTRVETARWHWPEAGASGERALRLAESLGPEHEDLAIAAALTLAILQRWGEGALRPARERLGGLLLRAREFERGAPARLPDQDNVMRRVLWELIWQDLHVGAYGEALGHLAELEGAGGRPGEVTFAMRGLIHLRRGDLPGALAATDAALDASERFHLKFPNVYGIRALCLLQDGRLEEARQVVTVGQAINSTYNHIRDRADSALRFGEVLLALGDPDGAQREYGWVLGTFSLPHVLGGLRGVAKVRAQRGDGPGAAFCGGAVLAHGGAGLHEEERVRATLAGLRTHFPADVIDAALAGGAVTPLGQVVARVRAELALPGPPTPGTGQAAPGAAEVR